MANLSNINNKLIVTDGGNLLVNATANLATYGGITIDNFSDPSIAMKTTSTSGWLWTQYITSTGTNNFSMGVNQSSPYWCVKAGAGMDTPHLVVNSSGDVGIGTITPQAALTVAHDLSNGGDATGFRLNAASGTTSNTLFGGPVSSGDYAFFQSYKEGTSAGVRDLSLNPIGGNVGIGTDSPNTRLEVRGGSGSGEIAHATFTATANRGLKISTTSLPSGQNSGTVIFNAQDTEGYSQQWFQIGGTTKMVIDNSGNVGIGRTSITQPTAGATSLAIQGTTTTSGGALRLYSSNDSVSAYIFADNASGLSINTSTSHPMVFRTVGVPRLTIDTSGQTVIINTAGNTLTLKKSTGAALNWNDSTQIRAGIHGINGADGMQFRTGSAQTERMRIKSDGNVLVADTRKIEFYNTSQYIHANSTNDLTLASGDDINYQSNYNRFFHAGVEGARISTTTASWVANGSNGTFGVNRVPSGSYNLEILGDTYSSQTIRAGGWFQGTSATNTLYSSTALGLYLQAPGNSGVAGKILFRDSIGATLMQIDSAGTVSAISQTGSQGWSQNGVSSVMNSGYIAGNATIVLTYTNDDQSSMFIECVMNHYGLISGYGCAFVAVLSNGPNITSSTILSVISGNGGSWSIARVNSTSFTVTKNAGTYSGGGHWYVKINGRKVYSA